MLEKESTQGPTLENATKLANALPEIAVVFAIDPTLSEAHLKSFADNPDIDPAIRNAATETLERKRAESIPTRE
ncbi:MAG: hypothetical protein WC470_00165 [Candidatus Paceibacterota bacterium]